MDPETLERARRGDPRAVEEIIAAAAPRLWRLGVRLGLAPALAEELIQEALYRGLCKLDGLREGRAAGAWFARILINLWRDRLRAGGRRDLLLGDVPEPIAPEALGPDAQAEALEVRERVERALEALPAGQRAVIALRVEGDMSVAEIAAALGSTPDRVKANLWHARRRLRRLLGDLISGSTLTEEA